MSDADDDESDAPPLAEMFLLDGLSPALRTLVGLLAIGLALGGGALALRVQHHYAAVRDAGGMLNGVATLLADGASLATAWPGWVAAICFAAAVVHLRRNPNEPPASRGDTTRLSAGELRAGLRREYMSVRRALVALAILAMLDAGRAVVYVISAVGHDMSARSALIPLLIEVGGLIVATGALATWARRFAIQLRRVGALSGTAQARRSTT